MRAVGAHGFVFAGIVFGVDTCLHQTFYANPAIVAIAVSLLLLVLLLLMRMLMLVPVIIMVYHLGVMAVTHISLHVFRL